METIVQLEEKEWVWRLMLMMKVMIKFNFYCGGLFAKWSRGEELTAIENNLLKNHFNRIFGVLKDDPTQIVNDDDFNSILLKMKSYGVDPY